MKTIKKPKRSGRVTEKSSLSEIYAWARKRFTAADLQAYTEPLVGVPLRETIDRMEAIQQGTKRRRGKVR